MARKIKFPLEMNGVEIRSLDELREHFSICEASRDFSRERLHDIDIKTLVNKTDGFSGADIEGVVKDAVESAFADDKPSIQTNDLVEAIKNTHSLSEIMADALKTMTTEYEKRKFKNASSK